MLTIWESTYDFGCKSWRSCDTCAESLCSISSIAAGACASICIGAEMSWQTEQNKMAALEVSSRPKTTDLRCTGPSLQYDLVDIVRRHFTMKFVTRCKACSAAVAPTAPGPGPPQRGREGVQTRVARAGWPSLSGCDAEEPAVPSESPGGRSESRLNEPERHHRTRAEISPAGKAVQSRSRWPATGRRLSSNLRVAGVRAGARKNP